MKKLLDLQDYSYFQGRGIVPDHDISWTQEDVARGQDPVLRFVQRHADSP